jgi:septal ring factor EnvC (AmiA/AmiB activator)
VELEARITRWRSDEKLAERLGSVALPDLTRTEITIDTGGGGELPDDLAELLRTADVTTITERTKVVARSMFEATTPATVREIQQGVDSGIAGLRSALDETATARQEMTDGLATMDANLAEMASGLAAMDSSLAEMATGIASMDAGLRDMGTAIPKMDASLAEMAAGLQGMDSGLAGLDAGIAGLAQPIAGLDTAIEGMEADQYGAQQRRSRRPIATLACAVTASRSEAMMPRVRDDRDQLPASSLAEQRGASPVQAALSAKLATGRAALATQRATLADGRAALSAERASLADGRASLAAARADLASARDELDATRTELADSIDKMAVLREAVPGAFDQALVGYLAEIDGRAPRIEATFAAGLGEGFRGVYLFDLAACLAALLVILAVPRGRIDPHHHDADDAVTVADRQPTTVPVGPSRSCPRTCQWPGRQGDLPSRPATGWPARFSSLSMVKPRSSEA